jgi:hypothetical protein
MNACLTLIPEVISTEKCFINENMPLNGYGFFGYLNVKHEQARKDLQDFLIAELTTSTYILGRH